MPSLLRMEGPYKERWKNLSKAVAEEKDPARFAELVQELLKELEAKEQRLKGATNVLHIKRGEE